MRSLGISIIILLFSLSANAQSAVITDPQAVDKVKVEKEPHISSDRSEFSPAFYGSNIAFVYTPEHGKSDPKISQPYFNIGYAEVGPDGFLTELIPFSPIFNTERHEGPLAYSEANEKIYFTRVNIITSEKSDKRIARRQIMEFDFDNQTTEIMLFNRLDHDVCHPTINEAGDMMVFAATYHGRKDMDLYYSNRIDGLWGTPLPLGASVNTDYNEFFPFLYDDDTIIFASDRPGMGGYDLYMTKKVNDVWGSPVLLPKPFNSTSDDLGMIVDYQGDRGYFSSNRSGNDDIYKWQVGSPVTSQVEKGGVKPVTADAMPRTILSVKEKLTFQPISHAKVSLIEIDLAEEISKMANGDASSIISDGEAGQLLFKMSLKDKKPDKVYQTDVSGNIVISYAADKDYVLVVGNPDYESYQYLMLGKKVQPTLELFLDPKNIVKHTPTRKTTSTATPVKKKVIIPTKIGETVVFDNIYYDYNSSKIKDGAAAELDALVQAMKSYPQMRVLLSAHTDSRGPHSYNQQLSEKRAISAMRYLERNGIDASRIETIGYGESKLRNHCIDNVNCTEAEHQYNRRTEVKILEN